MVLSFPRYSEAGDFFWPVGQNRSKFFLKKEIETIQMAISENIPTSISGICEPKNLVGLWGVFSFPGPVQR